MPKGSSLCYLSKISFDGGNSKVNPFPYFHLSINQLHMGLSPFKTATPFFMPIFPLDDFLPPVMLGLFKIPEAPVSTRHDTDKGVESVSDTPWKK